MRRPPLGRFAVFAAGIIPTAMLAATAPVAAGPAVTDDTGRRIELAAPARRVVSLSPHATELLFELGMGERIVGAPEFSDHPPAARNIPRIGGSGALDIERILALRPDMVVGWASGNPSRQIARLRALGLPLYLSEPRSLSDIAVTLRRLGVLVGAAAAGEASAASFEDEVRALGARYRGRPAVGVFYQVWDRPMVTVNGKHLINDIIELCGGRNVFAALPELAPAVDIEAVLRADPEAIVASGADAARPPWLDDWRRWRTLTAVARGNLFDVPPELVQRQTPRILEGAVRVCEALETARRRRPAPTR
jgi:iron complex transport system substrate-binding protein